jgi:pyruvate/2-oxoglutarate dehydrogenase complex dihydrolipoamide dehydrogenase (E3) component
MNMSESDTTHEAEFLLNVRPPGWRNPTPPGRYDLLVIGAGPSGLMAARTAASVGAKVALIEAGKLGGANLASASVPTKALLRTSRLYGEMHQARSFGVASPGDIRVDSALALERVRRIRARVSRQHSAAQLTDEGIELYFGFARFVGHDAVEVDGVRLRFEKALIATGSQAAMPSIPGVVDADQLTGAFFDRTSFPTSTLFIGGGPLVCEGAQAMRRLGSRTIIVNQEPLFLHDEDRDAAQMLSDALGRDGVEIHLNTQVVAVRSDGACKQVELLNGGVTSTVSTDAIVVGVGRRPAVNGLDLAAAGVAFDEAAGVHVDDFLRTSNPRIYAAGDVCLKHKFTDTAEASGRIVVANALFHGRRRMSALTIPWCTYTDPEIAHVGLYVHEARERDIPVKTFTVPMHEVDRAIADGEEDGFVKLHVRDGTDTLLGATIVARHAGEMINVISLAMVARIGLRKLAQVVYAYPTQAEAIKQAADAYSRTRVTPLRAWLLRQMLRF